MQNKFALSYSLALLLIAFLLAGCEQPTNKVTSIETLEASSSSQYYERNATGPKEEMGHWEQIPLAKKPEDRMQGVHTVLLPSGKVLMVNGSSNRNSLIGGRIEGEINLRNYAVINNMCVFDPSSNKFTKKNVPSVPKNVDKVNDLFCSGQNHLPNGNVLFAGGTQSYYPGEKFQGSKAMRTFDWKKEEWINLEDGKDGHWYPSVIPMEDGKVMIISGISEIEGRVSTYVEFYDYKKTGQEAWSFVDIEDLDNNPFQTKLEVVNKMKFDGLQMYPRMYAIPDGRFLLTHDGAAWGVNGGNQTKRTYFMDVNFNAQDKPSITFTYGPDRKDMNKVYGTAVPDPNNGDILLFAGQRGDRSVNNNDFGPGPWTKAGVEVTRTMERYRLPTTDGDDGEWEHVENFLGDSPEDGRIMHLATILPTKEILILNGGNYSYHRPLYYPILLKKETSAPGGYKLKQMNQAIQPRLYHNVALLLPDGRVLSAGGNAARAVFNPNQPDSVLLNVYKDIDGNYQEFHHGQFGIPAEIWQTEIFSPPYLFIEGDTPKIQVPNLTKNEQDMPCIGYDQEHTIIVDHATEEGSLVLIKLGSVTHGWDSGQRLIDLEITGKLNNRISFKAPSKNHVNVPAYYMMFYVNDKGRPSEAQIIQLTDLPSS